MTPKKESSADEYVYVPLRGMVKKSELNKKPRTAAQLAYDRRRKIDALVRKAQRLSLEAEKTQHELRELTREPSSNNPPKEQ